MSSQLEAVVLKIILINVEKSKPHHRKGHEKVSQMMVSFLNLFDVWGYSSLWKEVTSISDIPFELTASPKNPLYPRESHHHLRNPQGLRLTPSPQLPLLPGLVTNSILFC